MRREKKAHFNNSRTRAETARAHEEYSRGQQTAQKSIKADKRNNVDGLAREAEEAAYHGNMKGLYVITKKKSQKVQQATETSVGK